MATNLYRLLGKKTTTSDKSFYDNKKLSEKESQENIFSEDVMDYSQKQILELDKNFDFYAFLKGAKEAFKVIVESFKNNKLEEVKYLINEDVYEKFDNALNKDNKKEKFFKITSLKASILNIEVLNKCANIKVEFFSNQEEKISNNVNKFKNIKDVWTFKKDMSTDNLIWKLVEVGLE